VRVPKVEIGKPLHCLELVTGKNLTGTVLLSEERISIQIYSFADRFHIKGEHPVFLQTETNDIVSLHSNITTVPEHTRVSANQRGQRTGRRSSRTLP
jgi:hypothetical protein